MYRYLLFIGLIISSLLHGYAQEAKPSEDLKVVRERPFTGQGLYGFMNGGADLFLEFGVRKLINRDIIFKGEDFTIDIYEMPTPNDAFGIYSMQVFKCQCADTLGGLNCLSPYQFQAVVGKQYISIVFPSGSESAQKMAAEVLEIYLPLKNLDLPSFPAGWESSQPYSGNVKYLRGPISVSNASKALSGLLKDSAYTGVWFRKTDQMNRFEAYIHFNDPESVSAFKEKLDKDGIVREEGSSIWIKGEEKEEETPDFGPFGF